MFESKCPCLFCQELSSNLIDSESNSLSALNMSEDEYLEDNIMDNTFASSNLNQSLQQGTFSFQTE